MDDQITISATSLFQEQARIWREEATAANEAKVQAQSVAAILHAKVKELEAELAKFKEGDEANG